MTVTLKDIAKSAGVSVRSVTRALKDEPGGSKKTYAKILKIASELGYTPNIMARSLRTKSSRIVGMIVSGGAHEIIMKKQDAIQRLLEKEGLYILSALIPETEEEFNNLLKSWIGLTDTIILLAWNSRFKDSVLLNFPFLFIFVDCKYEGENGVNIKIGIDRSSGITKAVEFLIRKRHVNIVKAGTGMRDRIEGFLNAFNNLGIDVDEDSNFIMTESIEFEDGYNVGRELIDRKVSAVFFDTDRMALGFLKFAYENSIRIPRDIAVVGFDDDKAGAFSTPTLSTVAHPVDEIAETVRDIVIKKRQANDKKDISRKFSVEKPILFKTKFIKRESV